jgi:hypothetical protein
MNEERLTYYPFVFPENMPAFEQNKIVRALQNRDEKIEQLERKLKFEIEWGKEARKSYSEIMYPLSPPAPELQCKYYDPGGRCQREFKTPPYCYVCLNKKCVRCGKQSNHECLGGWGADYCSTKLCSDCICPNCGKRPRIKTSFTL